MNTAAISQHESTVPAILITGATGSVGSEVIKQLSDRGIAFRAMVRSANDVDRLSTLPGAEVVLGDFNDPATLAKALAGIERAFVLTNSSEQAETQQLRFVAEAQRAGVQHLVKLSQYAADRNSPVRFLRYHAVVEDAIRESGMNFTFLRPNLFMQGLLGFREPIRQQGKFFAAVGTARISVVDVRDIASVAAATLTEPDHDGKTYTITGPDALTHAEMADQLADALGKPVAFVDVPPAAMRQALAAAGFPDWQTDGLLEDYAHYSRNEASAVLPDVQEVTGKAARTFADFARDYASFF
ncbi:NAD(P)H azoreductase [Fibrisoma limi BUZ 3]|uniref:NAD(P)H azoreductase n=1 Tax=Fibrisoma limi BUZ 3 TaxID=1185876 RepID=I2GLQ2_9BACT|nr:SDR family oxidoreductase [Fibrisoma limi]CCH54828.1 NAD(P)H azoreductase [Fibrisoma limi BUZ 3]